jgi:predicted nucleic acid-binding protein
MPCCDTTFLADLFRKKPEAIGLLRELRNKHESICTTVITIAELFYGAYKSAKIEEERNKVRHIIESFLVFGLNVDACEKYGRIRAYLEKRGETVADRDIFISAISLSNGERVIITRNRKHFEKIPGINVLTY